MKTAGGFTWKGEFYLKQWFKPQTIIIVTVAVLLIAGGYAAFLYKAIKNTAADINVPLARDQVKGQSNSETTQQPPFVVLILGIDQREYDRGRSDTIMVIGVNPAKGLLMFSIPRDTRMVIAGREKMDKANHAYAFGGIDMSVRTLEAWLDHPIDYYVAVNMEMFINIVDYFGGVDVNVDFPFSYKGYDFEGEMHLEGPAALAYARMRFDDPRGDLGRNERQQQIISSLIDQGARLSTLTKTDDILNLIRANVRTNLSWDDIIGIHQNYHQAFLTNNRYEIKGDGRVINDVYYYLVSEQERNILVNTLRRHLDEEAAPAVAAGPVTDIN